MPVPVYSTDLSTIILEMPNTTGWSALGGGPAGLTAPETDYFIQGTNCISKGAWSSAIKGMIYDYGGGITVPSDGAVMFWLYYSCTNSLDTQPNGGIQAVIGSGSGDYKHWYVSGKNLLLLDVWRPYPVDPTISADATTGSPSATLQFFGGLANLPGSGPSKGAPWGIDAMRYGRCKLECTNGEVGDYCTFAGAETYANDVSRRWGLLELIQGAYFMQGFLSLGTAGTAVDFRDSDKVIFIRDTLKVGSAFNRIEVLNASSNVEWTNIMIQTLGTTSKGTVVVIAGIVDWNKCRFTDLGTFMFLSTSVITNTTFKTCDQITAPGSTMTGTIVDSYTGAVDTSALVWDVNTDPDGKLDDMTFIKGTNAHHAIEFGLTSPLTMTVRGWTISGFNAVNGQNDSTFHVKRTSGTVTINVIGGTGNFSYKSDGATVDVVVSPVTIAVHAVDRSGSDIQNARVYLQAKDGTGPFPFEESVTIVNSGVTATVTHTTHGMASNDYVEIKGAETASGSSMWQNNGVFQITVTDVNTYTYTLPSDPGASPSGTIKATFVALTGLTDINGDKSTSRVYPSNQPVTGWIRLTPTYKEALLFGAINSATGYDATGVLFPD